MPLLRGLERGERVAPDPRALGVAAGFGVIGGALALGALKLLDAPEMPGSLAVRLASAGFAAVTLEVAVHLLGMGLLMRWTRNVWLAIVTTALVFMAFHLPGALELGPVLAVVNLGANGGLALGMGWIGARLGFEYLILAHLVAHMVTVGAG